MTNEQFENIIKEQQNIKDLPNSKLIEFMDTLSKEFEESKKRIIEYSFHLDNVENIYNTILKEYQSRAI